MGTKRSELKIRVFNFLQNLIIYLSRGASLGVPNRHALCWGCLTGHASTPFRRTRIRKIDVLRTSMGLSKRTKSPVSPVLLSPKNISTLLSLPYSCPPKKTHHPSCPFCAPVSKKINPDCQKKAEPDKQGFGRRVYMSYTLISCVPYIRHGIHQESDGWQYRFSGNPSFRG